MNKKDSLVYGMGINDFNSSCKENGKDIKSYKTWKQGIKIEDTTKSHRTRTSKETQRFSM